MTNYNKLNQTQKDLLAEFMSQHPDLAKNLLPNCGQGKATCNRLWEELALKLNGVGPPIKDAKMWKKAYADQKYQAKKKHANSGGLVATKINLPKNVLKRFFIQPEPFYKSAKVKFH